MNSLIHVAIGMVVLLVLGYLFMIWRGISQNWRTPELKAGRVVKVEEDLRTDFPFRIVGRPDQVYQIAGGLHITVDNKNRDVFRVYETDVAELSLQAWLLRRNGLATTGHGYLVVNNRLTGERRALRTVLWNDEKCERLIQRYLDLVDGRVSAKKSTGPKCRSCGHRATC